MAKKKTKELQEELVDSAHKIWLAGLGALATAEEEGGKLFKNLVEKGQGFEDRGKEQVDKARGAVTGVKTVAESYWETFERTLDDRVTGVLHRIGVPTKDEIESLTRKVEDLTEAIEGMRAQETKSSSSRGSKAKSTKSASSK